MRQILEGFWEMTKTADGRLTLLGMGLGLTGLICGLLSIFSS
jgi:hypothetical protein